MRQLNATNMSGVLKKVMDLRQVSNKSVILEREIFIKLDFEIKFSVNVETMISMTIGTEKVSVRK